MSNVGFAADAAREFGAVVYLLDYRFGKRLPHGDVSSKRRRPRESEVRCEEDNVLCSSYWSYRW
jgi:hypothetical protein